MNNPIQFVQAMRNPQQFLQQMMNNNKILQNPIGKNAIEMYQRGDIKGINELASNLCKEKGTSLDEMTKNIRSQIGM